MLFKCIAVFAAGISATLAQTIELGFPQNGDNFYPGQEVTAQVIQPESMASTVQAHRTPEAHGPPDGYYQNFTVTIPSYLAKGPAIFTLTHFCLIGADWYPFLEFRNATVNIV
ncbi:hypothetical protein C8R48DRAFT_670545 [Suillus tomentosus]|nr:hypothetical protein C8R48DRAFT_670545 [Suillus tomentosus]